MNDKRRPTDHWMLPFEEWLRESRCAAIMYGSGTPALYTAAIDGDEVALQKCRDEYAQACERLVRENDRRAAEAAEALADGSYR